MPACGGFAALLFAQIGFFHGNCGVERIDCLLLLQHGVPGKFGLHHKHAFFHRSLFECFGGLNFLRCLPGCFTDNRDTQSIFHPFVEGGAEFFLPIVKPADQYLGGKPFPRQRRHLFEGGFRLLRNLLHPLLVIAPVEFDLRVHRPQIQSHKKAPPFYRKRLVNNLTETAEGFRGLFPGFILALT
ncbi:hypothetical protein [Victivallis vadensis]|uniref:hypothetical protein n=1 Tax=Victivallis vadensis TaxID=172901 RepID=UPI000E32A65E|nr:hypothetical protein [Victivallis vadensis]